MSSDAQKLTAASPNAISKKLELQLRAEPLAKELRELYITGPGFFLRELMQLRTINIASRYRLVLVLRKLQSSSENLLEQMGYGSLDEMLVHLDLPNGKQLANWEMAVELFSRRTCLLVGEEALSTMCTRTAERQKDPNEQRKDFQAIFEEYCKDHALFNKTEFLACVDRYLNRRYSTQIQAQDSVQTDKKRKHKGGLERSDKTPGEDIKTQGENQALKAYFYYCTRLRQIIENELSPKYLPAKPEVLTEYENTHRF